MFFRNFLYFQLFALLAVYSTKAPAQILPENDRSKEAVHRVETQLKKEMFSKNLAWGSDVFIRIFKEEAELEIWIKDSAQYRLFKTYPICTFSGELGPKIMEGDGQAPEGFYAVSPDQMNPQSSFHLSFNLGFPNAYDQSHGRTGSYLMIHGDCVSSGCYAMAKRWLPLGDDRNEPIEEIWTLMQAAYLNGQETIPVHAFPFRMTAQNMASYSESEWHQFWQNLKEGYDRFELKNLVPTFQVQDGKYIFSP